MLPYIHIWRFSLPTFGLMLWVAIVAAAFVMDRGFRRARVSADAVGMVATAALLGIVGAKLWHVIDTPMEFRELGWRVLWDTAGFAWFGGLLAGIAACAVLLIVFERVGLLWSVAILWLLLLAAAHVAANAFGSRNIADAQRRTSYDAASGATSNPVDVATQCAPATQLRDNRGFGRRLLMVTVAAAAGGLVLGTAALILLIPADLPGIVLGGFSAAILGGFLGFVAGSFVMVATRSFREATAEQRGAS